MKKKTKEQNYFSESYEEARNKFLEATKDFEVENAKIRDDLYIDFALKESKQKNKIIILVSGTHGVEGYLGSAAQLLFIQEHLPKLKNVSVCLIHSLNPYGFKHDRRVNENNVDLNRNAIYDERLILGIPNTVFSNVWAGSLLLLKLNRPRRHRLIERINFYTLLIKSIAKQGIKNTINISIAGQNNCRKSVGYKGVKLEDSLLYLRSYIEKTTKGYEEAILIDLHSGVGRKYSLKGFTNQPPKSKEFEQLKKILKKIISKTKIKFVDHHGSVSDLFLARSRAKKNTDLTIEYGTIQNIYSNLSFEYLGRLNIEENQVFYYGTEIQKQKTRKKYKKAYAPQDKLFRKSLIRKTRKFYENLVKELNK